MVRVEEDSQTNGHVHAFVGIGTTEATSTRDGGPIISNIGGRPSEEVKVKVKVKP